ncbi:MAG: hypothetical protein ACAI38_22280 [Myxococcota bacterium]
MAQSTLVRASSFWALVIYAIFVSVPVATLLSYRFPMWRVWNLFEAQPRTAMMLGVLGPIALFAGYLAARRALLAGRGKTAWWIILGSAVLIATNVVLFLFVDRSGPVPRESGRSLGHLAIGGLAVCVAGYVLMIWRVLLLASSERPAASVTQLPPPARDGRTKPIEAARKSGGKR